MRIHTFSAALALCGVVLTACGGDKGGGTQPQAGLLTVTLINAASAPGALMFTISGGEIDAVTAGSYATYQTSLSSTSRRILLTGNIVAGTLVQIQVPDVAKASNYVATVNQVAARSSSPVPYGQQPTNGFVITVD
jgi:hypothetical protein